MDEELEEAHELTLHDLCAKAAAGAEVEIAKRPLVIIKNCRVAEYGFRIGGHRNGPPT